MHRCGTLRCVSFPTPAPAPAAPKSKRWIWIIAAAAIAAALAVAAELAFTGGDSPTPTSAAATPEANGIKRPDSSCVTTDGRDHQDLWNANGWWAGRIDGEAKEMSSFAVLSLKLNGHQINSAWICAPRSNG